MSKHANHNSLLSVLQFSHVSFDKVYLQGVSVLFML